MCVVQVCADVCARSSTRVCTGVHVCGCRCVQMCALSTWGYVCVCAHTCARMQVCLYVRMCGCRRVCVCAGGISRLTLTHISSCTDLRRLLSPITAILCSLLRTLCQEEQAGRLGEGPRAAAPQVWDAGALCLWELPLEKALGRSCSQT